MSLKRFDHSKPVIAALHLPDLSLNRHLSVTWYEECALANGWAFAEVGIPWIKLQDQTKTAGPAAPDTLALLAALDRLIGAELPQLGLGIIIEAHDPVAALSAAHAAGSDFVRLSAYVDGPMTAASPRNGLTAEAGVADAMFAADDVIVSSALKPRDAGPEDLLRWDVDFCRRVMDAAWAPA